MGYSSAPTLEGEVFNAQTFEGVMGEAKESPVVSAIESLKTLLKVEELCVTPSLNTS